MTDPGYSISPARYAGHRRNIYFRDIAKKIGRRKWPAPWEQAA